MFVVPPDIPKITESFSDIFVYSHNKSLLEGLEKELDYKIEPQYKLEPMYQSAILKLDKLTLIN
ncbi:MAG TPA: hypothetical protein VK211_15965, partial [Kamptonema sp.]|nr:hypothetical protein [Kamptonema sp.]